MREKIGECLVQAGLISEDDLRVALAVRRNPGERLGAVLVRTGVASETQIAKALARQLEFPYVDIADRTPDPAAVPLIPHAIALEHVCVGLSLANRELTVAMADPLLFGVLQDLESLTGCRICQAVAERGAILHAIEIAYARDAGTLSDVAAASAEMAVHGGGSAEMRALEMIDAIVEAAIDGSATDIHFERSESGATVRHRLDGLLKKTMDLPPSAHEPLLAHLKALAGLDTGETRLAQDGRVRLRTADGRAVDFQLSTIAAVSGEKAVLRRVGALRPAPGLDDLGILRAPLDEVRRLLARRRGLLLIAGPAASGRTTTLAAAAGVLKSEQLRIVSVADVIDYELTGVNQIHVDPAGRFVDTLRSALRQDSDIVLLDEIQDTETAVAALSAAEDVRLVIAVLRADDAAAGITRLLHFGIEPRVVASAFGGVVAQRLVRRLCPHCRQQSTPSAEATRWLAAADTAVDVPHPFYEAVGCDQCSHTGYRGRTGLYEVMRATDALRRLIGGCAPEDRIRYQAVQDGMATLADDGFAKVAAGISTLDELVRAVPQAAEVRTLCGSCGTVVGADFKACPCCGRRLGAVCGHCGRAVQPGWHFCPYCARAMELAHNT